MLFVLVINGDNLNYVINNTKNRIKFIQLCEMCTNVICCRTTPGQKAAVVTLVKNELNVHTLAIGDGANDVNMIQVANVGIGINSGEEGMQAVMASDFAISQFRYLKQLLLVHGHCCYDKLAHTSLYLFYKDAIYIFLLFWFQMFNGFSGSNAIDQFSQILFSVTITGLPPFIMGIWDNPLDDKTLLANPILYRAGINGNAYRPWLFWLNIFDGLWQSLIVFFLSYFAYADDTIGLWEFGLFQTNAITLCTLLHSLLISRTLVVFHAVSFLVSYVLAYLMFTMIYHAVAVTAVPPECPYRIIFHTMNNAKFWLLTLITIILALLPRFLMITIKNTFYPNLDTIANLLTKYYGTGQHLPLESYLLRMPYSFLIRNNNTILPTMNQLTSYTSDVNLNKSFNESTIDKSIVHNHQLHNHASIHSNNQSNLITITDTSFHLISHLAQILNLSNQIIHGVQPSINTSNQYTDNISHDTMATNDYYQQINITPRMITDYTNQYQQHHYHTFSGNVLCNRKLLTQRRYSTTHVDYDYDDDDDDDDENNKNEQHCRNNVLWSTMNTNNRILDSSISTEISTNDYHNKSLKHRQQRTQQQQQQQQYSTYPSARTSSKHRSSLHHDRHSSFKLDPSSYHSN
ncbi:putative phospholipid-transporting ATPase VB [Schistosoma japonicum]|uniref:Putative phospholipid-transporting ATPase VB n=1 Tax=Schistosoma japonicum TaxID=6182 RepID=A0A4Z2D8E8_SCHJA|nr:putative phospholipid-transporting ATPase VB [Schistosoma japonicum]